MATTPDEFPRQLDTMTYRQYLEGELKRAES